MLLQTETTMRTTIGRFLCEPRPKLERVRSKIQESGGMCHDYPLIPISYECSRRTANLDAESKLNFGFKPDLISS